MNGRFRFSFAHLCLACVTAAIGVGGCTHGRQAPDPRLIQAATMNFADRYVAAMADEYDRAGTAAKTPEAMIMAQRMKILAGTVAMGNAVDPNPLAGLMDMAVFVTLTHEIARDPWVAEMFGQERADAIVATLKAQDADIWRTAGLYLAPAQVQELRDLVTRWRAEHPDQRYATGVRLADLLESRGGGGNNPVQQLAGSVFGLVTLDPFRGLDPAVKEVTETRVMAERLFFYLRHSPILMTWQVDSLFDQMLAQPQMTQMFTDTTTVAGSTTRFSDATSRFSDASNELAQTVEKFRLQLPEQQATLVAELNDLVARQRDGALQQATTQIAVQRDATIQQLGATVAAQQDLMTRNLQTVTDQSIDRLYLRTRSLVLITVGSIFLAFILYRLIAGMRRERTMA